MSEGDKPDLIEGVAAIAEHLGMKRRRVQYLHESGQMPTFLVGKVVCARRSTLTKWLAGLEAGLDAGVNQ